jgi:D-lactate dehydrogenase (cytochrome)
VITEVTVRLYGIPSAISAATCSFPSVEDAVNTVIQTIHAGIAVARIELADAAAMDSIIQYSKLDLPVAPVLWMEFHGAARRTAWWSRLKWSKGLPLIMAVPISLGQPNRTKPEESRKLWQARHDAYYAFKAAYPGMQVWATDVCVPIS